MNSGGGTLRTTAFRIAAVYAVLYAVLTGAMVAVVFALAQHQIYIQIRDGLIDESTALATLLDARGPDVLRDFVRIRSREEAAGGGSSESSEGMRYYILANAAGQVLVGDLKTWPRDAPAGGWYRFRAGRRGEVLALVTRLGNGMHLLVGQSLATPTALSAGVRLWVPVGAGFALLAGLLGGAALGTRVMRNIREASATAERIQNGRLSERLPTGGAGEQAVLAEAFNSMLDRIETAVIGLRDLGARTAHEMKHPLARADRALARAAGEEDVEALRADIAAARSEIGDLTRRINALRRLARMQAGAAPEFFGDVDLVRVATDVVELYAPSAEERGGRLVLEAPESLRLVGDRQLLAQAIANLVDNAIKYGPEGRPIVVRILSTAAAHRLEVEDAGSGPAHSAAEREPGTGLGLAITRAIAELHRGSLERTQRAGGHVASLRLPRSG